MADFGFNPFESGGIGSRFLSGLRTPSQVDDDTASAGAQISNRANEGLAVMLQKAMQLEQQGVPKTKIAQELFASPDGAAFLGTSTEDSFNRLMEFFKGEAQPPLSERFLKSGEGEGVTEITPEGLGETRVPVPFRPRQTTLGKDQVQVIEDPFGGQPHIGAQGPTTNKVVSPTGETISETTAAAQTFVPPRPAAPPALRGFYEKSGQRHGVAPTLLERQGHVESGFNVHAIGAAGEEGLAQFMPATSKALGINALNPEEAIEGQAAHVRELFDKYVSLGVKNPDRAAFAAYNLGEPVFDKHLAANGGQMNEATLRPITQKYLLDILGPARELQPGQVDQAQPLPAPSPQRLGTPTVSQLTTQLAAVPDDVTPQELAATLNQNKATMFGGVGFAAHVVDWFGRLGRVLNPAFRADTGLSIGARRTAIRQLKFAAGELRKPGIGIPKEMLAIVQALVPDPDASFQDSQDATLKGIQLLQMAKAGRAEAVRQQNLETNPDSVKKVEAARVVAWNKIIKALPTHRQMAEFLDFVKTGAPRAGVISIPGAQHALNLIDMASTSFGGGPGRVADLSPDDSERTPLELTPEGIGAASPARIREFVDTQSDEQLQAIRDVRPDIFSLIAKRAMTQ